MDEKVYRSIACDDLKALCRAARIAGEDLECMALAMPCEHPSQARERDRRLAQARDLIIFAKGFG